MEMDYYQLYRETNSKLLACMEIDYYQLYRETNSKLLACMEIDYYQLSIVAASSYTCYKYMYMYITCRAAARQINS